MKTSVETLDICQKQLTAEDMQSLLNQPLKGWNDLSVMSVLCKPCIFQNTTDADDPITDVVTHEWFSNALNHYWNYGVRRYSILIWFQIEHYIQYYIYYSFQ